MMVTTKDLKLIPADEVPPQFQRKRKGIYYDLISEFIESPMNVAYIDASSNDDAKNIQTGLRRAINKRGALFDQIGFSVRSYQRRNPPRAYLAKIREAET